MPRMLVQIARKKQTHKDAMEDPEEINESFLHLEETIEDQDNITYVLRWVVRDHARIVSDIHYRCHYIRIQNSIHNLRIFKQDTRVRHLMDKRIDCIFLGLKPATSANISFVLICSKNKEIYPQNKGTLGNIPDRKCFYEFSGSDLHMEYLDLVALCKITVAKSTRFDIGVDKSTIVHDFESFYGSELFSDMKICVGDKEFDVHKVVLAARSPVFAAMLRNTMKENSENRIEIEDSNETAVGELLRYFYSEKTIPLTVDLALDLFELSDKYDIQTLKTETADFLRCNFSIENILDILVAADLHNDKVMKREAIEYIANNLWYLLKSPKWKSFRRRIDLVDCILVYLS